jgi:hypothetical protein
MSIKSWGFLTTYGTGLLRSCLSLIRSRIVQFLFPVVMNPNIYYSTLTYSMVQDIILKADCYSACQKISCFLMEPEGSLPCSQKPATGPYPEQVVPKNQSSSEAL